MLIKKFYFILEKFQKFFKNTKNTVLKVIQNINKSIKIKKINSAFRQSPFYLVDIIYIFYSLLKNVVFNGFPYNKNFTIVTASDDRFFDSLTQLLENLKKYSLLDKVHLYDLGMKILN